MTAIRIRPGTANGSLTAPPSKSYTHRALVAAHLARRPFRVERPLRSDDTLATVRAIRALGSSVRIRPRHWTVAPASGPAGRVTIDCGESGTTLRFASALAALHRTPVRLTGRGRLPFRPLRALTTALSNLGASIDRPTPPRTLPMTITGPMHGGRVEIDASESSQFVSALLLTLPVVRPSSDLRLATAPVSAPYIDATRAVLGEQGVRLGARGRRFAIPGGQRYGGRRFRVPGDASSAAYLWAAAAITGGTVTVRGIDSAWPQADLTVLDLLVRCGATVRRSSAAITVTGGERRPFRMGFDAAPDLYPLAGVLAATADGRSVLQGGAHAAAKESDRRAETARLARAFGATARLTSTALTIDGTPRPRAIALRDALDHRVVMSAAVGALAAAGESRVGDARAVRKSYPGFWRDLRRLVGGGRIR